MKLTMMSTGNNTLNALMQLNEFMRCHGAGSDTCLDYQIDTILNKAQDECAYDFQRKEIDFLRLVSVVQFDGRSCPGSERYRELKKLTNDSWKKDLHIIKVGIRTHCIELEQDDINKLS